MIKIHWNTFFLIKNADCRLVRFSLFLLVFHNFSAFLWQILTIWKKIISHSCPVQYSSQEKHAWGNNFDLNRKTFQVKANIFRNKFELLGTSLWLEHIFRTNSYAKKQIQPNRTMFLIFRNNILWYRNKLTIERSIFEHTEYYFINRNKFKTKIPN